LIDKLVGTILVGKSATCLVPSFFGLLAQRKMAITTVALLALLYGSRNGRFFQAFILGFII